MAPFSTRVSPHPCGEEKACGRLSLLQQEPVLGQVSCHGSCFTEATTGKEKKREVERAWLLHPSWALLRLGAVQEELEQCQGS